MLEKVLEVIEAKMTGILTDLENAPAVKDGEGWIYVPRPKRGLIEAYETWVRVLPENDVQVMLEIEVKTASGVVAAKAGGLVTVDNVDLFWEKATDFLGEWVA